MNPNENILGENPQKKSSEAKTEVYNNKKLFLESYGCAMNYSDSEIVASIMLENGYIIHWI